MKLRISAALLAVVVITALLTQPKAVIPIDERMALPALAAEALDNYLSVSERTVDAVHGMVPETAKRIVWLNAGEKQKTPYSLVYFHGFSATRQEIAPVAADIAAQLSANLYETRLAGHGLLREPMHGVTAEDWLRDAAEALAIGAAIGDRVIVMGTSTGATLAMAMLGSEMMNHVEYLILLSPNLVLQDKSSEFLLWPGGPLVARALVGSTRTWVPRNELQAKYWTTVYPLDSVIEMMRLVNYTRDHLPATASQHLLTISSPLDQVVDAPASRAYIEKIDAAENRYVSYSGSTDEGQHVLAGNILSPHSNRFVTELVVRFVRGEELPTTVPGH